MNPIHPWAMTPRRFGKEQRSVWRGCSRPPLTTRSTTRVSATVPDIPAARQKTPPEVPGHLDKLGMAGYGAVPRRPDLVPELFTEPSTQPDDDALVRLHGNHDERGQMVAARKKCCRTLRPDWPGETGVNDQALASEGRARSLPITSAVWMIAIPLSARCVSAPTRRVARFSKFARAGITNRRTWSSFTT